MNNNKRKNITDDFICHCDKCIPSHRINLTFHDDNLLGINIDFEHGIIELKIQTFQWIKNKNPEALILQEAKKHGNGKIYSTKPDQIVYVILTLTKESSIRFNCDQYPEEIMDMEINDGFFSMTLVMGNGLNCHIQDYKIEIETEK